ncbi:MAG: tRNA uridine-5-carboxymethylaminomethyl(34) synthesis GTPase MnmE [Bacteroidetes bacterium]|nr:MAG: tRNA uridine-5-carboxymethylaminomethyl(34) synthesis GTPase MnmE [Bacteroidota bacterium]
MSYGNSFSISDTIVALSTPTGIGAIGVIRVSGNNAFSITEHIFKGKKLSIQHSHTAHFGHIIDKESVVDEVVATVFKNPNSFTKEDVVEISCHGSPYIINKIIKLLIQNGCRYARAGEFTQRAFLNGRFDLAQAEAVADLIASENESAHTAAMNQMRGGFSKELKNLREELVNFASLIELELDFAEEDVAFANRDDLKKTVLKLHTFTYNLVQSFDLGNAIKNGVPIVIAGKPNAGKSTLLNTLLNEEKAIVSDIAGTTRDVIEDELTLDGIKFRFIDTAGLRETTDKLEAIGIERTRKKMSEASLILYLFDIKNTTLAAIETEKKALLKLQIPIVLVANKIDGFENSADFETLENIVFISALEKNGIEQLKSKLLKTVKSTDFKTGDAVITNIRHFENLTQTQQALERILEGLDLNISGDLLAQDIRQALFYLGQITGEVTTDDLLGNIFSKFCIGK